MSKELPEDVMINILSRVPTRYLLRFKSVSKSWYALFQNPNFISKHFQNQSAISDPSFLFTYRKSFMSNSPSDRKIGLIFPDYSYKSIRIPIEIDLPYLVHGSCNGLICLGVLPSASIILLYNPATRVFKDLPISPIHRPQAYPLRVVLCFGFDDVLKDYKVLRVVDYEKRSNQVEMYSLSTNSWREIKTDVHFKIDESNCSVFLNGKFHWTPLWFEGMMGKRMIMCFDVREEVYSYIMLPEFESTESFGEPLDVYWQVVSIKESLAVISWNQDWYGSMMMFQVWMMKEYGGVWTKYTSFELQTTVATSLGCGFNGEILFQKDFRQQHLVVYDLDSKKRLKILGNHHVDFEFGVFNHVGTLLPINGGKVATRTNLSSLVPDAFFVDPFSVRSIDGHNN